MNAIDIAMKSSGTKQDFIKNMERQGYAVRWEDSRKYITYTCPNTMSCRDIKLHDNRYLKEMMEREFKLRRIETAQRRLSASRAVARTTVTDDRTLSSDTGEAGQPVIQSDRDLGGYRDFGETAEKHATAASQPQSQAGQPALTGAVGANQQEPNPNPADLITGWEAEREAFFFAEIQITSSGMCFLASEIIVGVGSVAADIVRLGKSVEQLGDPTPIKDSTTKKVAHERKKGIGQKEDDHSGHDFEITMY